MSNLQIDSSWIKKFDRPTIIAGPCSAESKEQLLETAKSISEKSTISLFRAGLWKPRTRPNCFEGVGSVGLDWLKEIKTKYGLEPIVEVASKKHAEEAYGSGIRYFWIGARTTVNPFLVQEIADSLKEHSDIVVMIKNPVNPDLDLWIGAIERLCAVGISKIGVIHRGFSAAFKSNLRNRPKWFIPIELKRRFPNIPMICDPSHICGDSDYIHEISQKAMDLNFDGLMIETHINPKEALSDSSQQITPNDLCALLSSINLRSKFTNNDKINNLLQGYREKIDNLDSELLAILKTRMNVVENISQLKQDANLTVLQIDRWNSVLEDRISQGKQQGLDDKFVSKIFNNIHIESLKKQINQ